MAQPKKRRPDLPRTRRGYEPYECISALQKAIRRSQPKHAVYWGWELTKSGYDAWAWARLNEILSEDIGPADRDLPATIKALEETSKYEKKRKNGGGLQFVHAVLLMATAKKSRIVDWLLAEVNSGNHERLEIPDYALDRHTRRGLRMGRDWSHFMAQGALLIDPDQAAETAVSEEHPTGYSTMDEWMEDLERASADHFDRRMEKDPTLPDNPWSKKGKFDQESWLPTEPAEPAQQELPTEEEDPK
jgi:replication-associated recombination protein RarA